MSVYPIYLVLGSDGTIGAYAREDVLLIDLAMNKKAGFPARWVFKLSEHMITITYEPTNDYARFLVPLENLCDLHKRHALPKPSAMSCVECEKRQKAAGA